jgi:hypothetical protein
MVSSRARLNTVRIIAKQGFECFGFREQYYTLTISQPFNLSSSLCVLVRACKLHLRLWSSEHVPKLNLFCAKLGPDESFPGVRVCPRRQRLRMCLAVLPL